MARTISNKEKQSNLFLLERIINERQSHHRNIHAMMLRWCAQVNPSSNASQLRRTATLTFIPSNFHSKSAAINSDETSHCKSDQKRYQRTHSTNAIFVKSRLQIWPLNRLKTSLSCTSQKTFRPTGRAGFEAFFRCSTFRFNRSNFRRLCDFTRKCGTSHASLWSTSARFLRTLGTSLVTANPTVVTLNRLKSSISTQWSSYGPMK